MSTLGSRLDKTRLSDGLGRRTRLGLVGLGYWGSKYLRLMREIPRIEIAFVVDSDSSRFATLAIDESVPKYVDPDEAFDAEAGSADGVIVVTPASSHRKVVESCLDHGLDVLVEKPMALSVQDALFLAHVSKQTGKLLYPGHVYAHNDGIRALTNVASTSVGSIRYVTCQRTGLGPVRGDVNVLWDLVPHDLTILDCMGLRRPQVASATGNSFLQKGVEDVVFCNLVYPGGIVAHIQASWLEPYKVRRVTLVGSKQTAVFDDLATEEPVKVYQRGVDMLPTSEYGEFRAQVRSGDVYVPYVPQREPLRNMLEDFLVKIQRPNDSFDNLNQGVSVVAALEALSKSIQTGGSAINVKWDQIEEYVTIQ